MGFFLRIAIDTLPAWPGGDEQSRPVNEFFAFSLIEKNEKQPIPGKNFQPSSFYQKKGYLQVETTVKPWKVSG